MKFLKMRKQNTFYSKFLNYKMFIILPLFLELEIFLNDNHSIYSVINVLRISAAVIQNQYETFG